MRSFGLRTLLLLIILSACGAFKTSTPSRSTASITDSQDNLIQDLEDKLDQIHIYQVIGQKQLYLFDEQIESTEIENVYDRPAYLKLQVIRTQVDELEHSITNSVDELNSDKANSTSQKKKFAIFSKIQNFAKTSSIHQLSVENLMNQFNLKQVEKRNLKKSVSIPEIEKEISELSSTTQYQVFEKNIEHMSYMLESRSDDSGKRIYPSSSKAGNITGNEFPAKVWSLTFDDGPKEETSAQILESLKKFGLKATFFQLTNRAQANPKMAKMIRDEGMEIASHSFSHLQLTKVGTTTLEKEISLAAKGLSKLHDKEIKFFRLPYGAGVSAPNIREKIAENGLVHVFWNVDTLDWMSQPPSKIVARTIALMKKTKNDSGVLLFHDIHQRTAEAVPEIMEYLKQENRRVCTLDEIVTQLNQRAETVCP